MSITPPRQIDDFSGPPTEKEMAEAGLAPEMSMDAKRGTMNSVVSALVLASVRQCLDARQVDGIDERYEIEHAEFMAENKPSIGANGEVLAESENGFRRAGLTAGLFVDNCLVVPSILREGLLGNDPISVDFIPSGVRSENQQKTSCIKSMAEKDSEDMGFDAEVDSALQDLPMHGTCILRQFHVQEREMVRDDEDNFIEQAKPSRGGLKHWPLLNAYVSNPERPMASDQAFVVWESMVTLSELEASERVGITVESSDPDGMPIETTKFIGKYRGIDKMREGMANGEGVTFTASMRSSRPSIAGRGTTDEGGMVTADGLYRLYEFQGKFPIGRLLQSGEITPEWLDEWSALPALRSAAGDQTALARACDSLTWYVSIAIGEHTEDAGQLIELSPAPYRRQRHEMLAGKWIPNKRRFYGLSSHQIGRDVSNSADSLFNSIYIITANNARPNMGYLPSAFQTEADAARAYREEGRAIPLSGGVDAANKAMSFFLKPWDQSFLQVFNLMVTIYTIRTMAVQGQKGGSATTGTGTYSEYRDQIQQAENRLRAVMKRLAVHQLIVPFWRNWLEDLDFFNTDEELSLRARRVAGELGLDSETIWPTAANETGGTRVNLATEYLVRHKGMTATMREIASQFMLQIAEKFGPLMPNLDMDEMVRFAIENMGVETERFFRDARPMRTAKDDVRMILAGDRPKPDPKSDPFMLIDKLAEYDVYMLGFQSTEEQAIKQGISTEAIRGCIKVLQALMDETQETAMRQLQELMAAMNQQSMMPQPVGPEPKGDGNNGGGSPSKIDTPKSPSMMESGRMAGAKAPAGGETTGGPQY